MSLTLEETEQRGREQLWIEAERRADNYAAAVAEFQKKKAEAALLRQNGAASINQNQNSPQPDIRAGTQAMPDKVIAGLDRRNIILTDGEVRALLSGCILTYGEMEFAIRGGDLVVEHRLYKHANHTQTSATKQSELLSRWQKAIRKKL